MMKNKKKGSNAERELLLEFFKKGFAVLRVAGSGSSSLPCPDLIAIKKGSGVSIECKTKKGLYLNIKQCQIEELKIWEETSGFKSYVAWRLGKDKWYFLHYSSLNKTKKAYSIKKEEIIEKGKIFEEFLKGLK
jgi:Holliday junction resolvase